MQDHKLTFIRRGERRTSDDVLREQLEFIARRALSGNRGRGWTSDVGPISAHKDLNTGKWEFTSTIKFTRRIHVEESKLMEQTALITEFASAAGHNARFQACPWVCQTKMGAQQLQTSESSSSDPSSWADDESPYVELSDIEALTKDKWFDHLYGLDAQIEVLLSALQAAADSQMKNRFHSLLWGDPGCGKTEILQSVYRLLTKLQVHCLILDATSTTEAGMRKNLLDEDTSTPDVMLIEEIEKVPETSLRWLLGIMDVRATISQANYRRTASRRVPAIVLATANDMRQLRSMMYGALHSRFQHEIYCPRPDRAVLAKILQREVSKVNGNSQWIEPALKFCCDELKLTDPRKIVPVCLCGKDKLLTGEYQTYLRKTMLTTVTV